MGRGLATSEGEHEFTVRHAAAILAKLRRAPQLRIALDPMPAGVDGAIACRPVSPAMMPVCRGLTRTI